MSKNKPSIPKGTRDFGPEIMSKRNFIFNAIKTTFQKFGFLQLETPSMENLNVLTGKYGDEGDQLIFKVLNSGDYLSKVKGEITEETSKSLLPQISEKGLRYDLTVPFARYVVMNRGTISFPFKRFQIQPVWRADRPQKGRYREFFQCDADVVGTNSLLCEAEIVAMINEVFTKIGIENYSIKINNRKILSGIAELIGAEDKESDLFVAIDKLDKIGLDKVIEELQLKGFADNALTIVRKVLSIQANDLDGLVEVRELLKGNATAEKGIEELDEVISYLENLAITNNHLEFDVTLARGLSYYTGAIFEVKVNDVKIGSVSGGGRYDNLTGVFGLPDVSGVGFSFGVDRIYDVLEALDLFPKTNEDSTKVLLINFDKESELYGLGVLSKLRANHIASELYPDSAKMKKQFSYANNKNIPYTLVIGSDEIESGKLTLKNMESGEQNKLTIEEIIDLLK
jgi:histidyl-tRNA synthetase